MVLEGVPWFLSPSGVKRMIVQFLPVRERSLRLMGFVLMLTGLVTVYCAGHF